MSEFLSTPGMGFLLAIVLTLHALSLIILGINLSLFLRQCRKYCKLYEQVGGHPSAWGHPGRILVPLYVTLTILLTLLSTYFFLWQPHIL